MTAEKGFSRRYAILALGVLLMLCIGSIYAWSVYASLLKNEFDWGGGLFGWVFTLSIIDFCLGGMLGSAIAKKRGPRAALLIAAAMTAAGFFFASRIQAPWQLFLAYGVCCGLGFGIGYNTVITCVNGYFPDKLGFSAGFLMLGMGFGSMVFGAAVSRAAGAIGWRGAFVFAGVVIALILASGAFVIRRPETANLPAARTPVAGITVADVATTAMLKRASFWLYFAWCTLLPIGGLLVTGNAVALSAEFGASARLGVFCTGIISLASGAGRVFWGMCYDAKGRRSAMTWLSVASIAAPALLIIAFLSGSIAVLICALVLIGVCYGGCPTINTTFLREFYGKKYFSDNFAVLNMSLLIASLCSSPLASFIHARSGSYGGAAYAMLGINIVAFFIMRFIKRP